MRILHLPMEVGGQVREICLQLRKLGHEAIGYNWRHNYLKYDRTLLSTDAYEMAGTLDEAIRYFDLFHYHTGYTMLTDKTDILRVLEGGRKVVMHHRGNDVRLPDAAERGPRHCNPYVYTGDSQPRKQIIRNLKFFSRHISTAIVQDFELYDYVSDYYEQVHILPRLIDVERIKPPERPAGGGRPLVVHAPTSRAFKGTEVILGTVERLKREVAFDFVLIEKMSLSAALDSMRAADIVIDQVRCGMYGNVSVEAMALGKPVICYLRPDIQARLPAALPIVSADPETLYDELRALLLDDGRRRQLGAQGRSFAVSYHAAPKVARRLVDIYRGIVCAPGRTVPSRTEGFYENIPWTD